METEDRARTAKGRYDRKSPVVSFRVSRKQLDRLDELIRDSGMSRGRFLRRALNTGLDKKDLIYRKGYKKGYQEAMETYRVQLLCDKCGELITVKGFEEEAIVSSTVDRVLRVYHKDCERPQDGCDFVDR